MTITISISSTIGGSGKTTIACMFAELLSANYKVLALDLCGQCNLTEVLLQDNTVTETICDVLVIGDVTSCIVAIDENLHIIPGDQWIGATPSNFYIQGYKTPEVVISMKELLNQAMTDYDFVVVDSPSTSAQELFDLSLSISDFAIMTYSPHKLNLINQWLKRIKHVQNNFNPNLRVGGILRTRFDKIEALHKYRNQEVLRHFPELCWNNVFLNAPLFANLDIYGIGKKGAVSAFKPIYDELILRLLNSKNGVKYG
ncbi:ParA family protein [Paenibacillus polymyxa]|uniref:ParA family protein n=1 Tax=Paenibacillus polymyxa TaxID=1406 RepID=UPI00237A001C|nr:ParA family protein [Paenibacillus polymyxa]WDM21287.1 ParA family protein [Paenibacillus polymyxa]